MKEIVDEVLQEEESALRLVEQSKSRAQETLTKAKKEADDFIGQEALKLKDSIREKKDQAQRSFLAEKERIIREIKESSIRLRQNKEKEIPALARKVFSQIIAIGE
ncbi:MAG: hypothetical protein WCI77_07285 [Candidatus Omnitrophota bacterium]